MVDSSEGWGILPQIRFFRKVFGFFDIRPSPPGGWLLVSQKKRMPHNIFLKMPPPHTHSNTQKNEILFFETDEKGR
jgi:hypothetical protein